MENFCYVGDCPVCDEMVDESKAGYCESCGQPFHWSKCGSWYNGKHMCNFCKDSKKNNKGE